MTPPEPNLAEQIIEVAADVFGVPASTLSRHSTADAVDAWDSISHLNLMLAIEQALGVTIPPDRMPELNTIEKLVAEIDPARRS